MIGMNFAGGLAVRSGLPRSPSQLVSHCCGNLQASVAMVKDDDFEATTAMGRMGWMEAGLKICFPLVSQTGTN